MKKLLLALLALLAAVPPADAQDAEGSADHPMISRYRGSRIIGYDEKTYDRYTFALGPATRDSEHSKPLEVEGRTTRILYMAPEGRTAVEVYRNYDRSLQRAGFEEMYRCTAGECGRLFKYIQPHGSELYEYAFKGFVRDWEYAALKLSRPEGDVYVGLHVAIHESPHNWLEERVVTRLDVIEVEAMEGEMVTVDAAAMREDITSTGKAVLYGIHFETDAATLTSDSDATLEEIATLLGDDPGLKLHVVGHTDDVGTLEYNLDLSSRRAAAVRAALTERFGIAAERLVANGVGPLAPVASNESEQGRALNRRVELVPIR